MVTDTKPKPTFEEYLNNRNVIWWPWWVAAEFLRRKTLIEFSPKHLIALAKKRHFKSGKIAGAPSRLAPVDKASFMNWVQGKAEIQVNEEQPHAAHP